MIMNGIILVKSPQAGEQNWDFMSEYLVGVILYATVVKVSIKLRNRIKAINATHFSLRIFDLSLWT